MNYNVHLMDVWCQNLAKKAVLIIHYTIMETVVSIKMSVTCK